MSYIGNPIVSTDFPVDYFSGNGSTTVFTLSIAPASVNAIDVEVSGVSQSPQTYTISGTTLTFSAAPPSGSSNIVIKHRGVAGTPTVPAIGSVVPASMSTGAPSWSSSGGVSLPRIDSSNEGGQLNFNRASDDTATWSIDSYGNTSTPTLRFLDGANVRMALDGSGNVGIGTASPSTRFHINQALNADTELRVQNLQSGGYATAVRLFANGSTGTSYNYIESYDATNSVNHWAIGGRGNAQTLCFTTGGSERMRIASNGSVMIGTSTATAGMLAVYANNAISIDGPTNGPYIEVRKAGTVIGYFGSGAAINSGNIGIYSTTGAVNVQSGGSGGVNLNSGATSWSSASDARLKDVTGTYSNALNAVAQLEPVRFTWKDDADKKPQVGILAQSIQNVVPEAIDTFNQKDDETDYLAVRYTELIPLLTAAIQELNAKVEAQAAEIQALKGTV